MSYLFVLCSPDNGSTLLHHLLLTSSQATGLSSAGQMISGYKGVLPRDYNSGHIFSEIKSYLQDESLYDWNNNKTIWDESWKNPSSQNGLWSDLLTLKTGLEPILLQKSPPDIYRINMIKQYFYPLNVIIMVRNPYAVAANIKKLRPDISTDRIATHIGECLTTQQNNAENIEITSLKITYEDLCDKTQTTCENIINFIPEIQSLNYSIDFNIKQHSISPIPNEYQFEYNIPITNLNEQEIATLTQEEINLIGSILSQNYQTSINYWNYEIL
jgi:hypothetical protein